MCLAWQSGRSSLEAIFSTSTLYKLAWKPDDVWNVYRLLSGLSHLVVHGCSIEYYSTVFYYGFILSSSYLNDLPITTGQM